MSVGLAALSKRCSSAGSLPPRVPTPECCLADHNRGFPVDAQSTLPSCHRDRCNCSSLQADVHSKPFATRALSYVTVSRGARKERAGQA